MLPDALVDTDSGDPLNVVGLSVSRHLSSASTAAFAALHDTSEARGDPGHNTLSTALTVPGITSTRPAFDHGQIRLDQLTNGNKPELVETSEHHQARVAKVEWSTSRSFGMGCVKNFHHPGQLDPRPTTKRSTDYALIRAEPP